MQQTTEASVVIAVPVEVVYRATLDLPHYPLFMAGVRTVMPLAANSAAVRWTWRTRRRIRTCDVMLDDTVPYARVAWRSAAPGCNDGVFQLEPLGDQTRVTLRWSCNTPMTDASHAAATSLRNLKLALETGETRRGRSDVIPLAAVAAACACIAAGLILIRAARRGAHG